MTFIYGGLQRRTVLVEHLPLMPIEQSRYKERTTSAFMRLHEITIKSMSFKQTTLVPFIIHCCLQLCEGQNSALHPTIHWAQAESAIPVDTIMLQQPPAPVLSWLHYHNLCILGDYLIKQLILRKSTKLKVLNWPLAL